MDKNIPKYIRLVDLSASEAIVAAEDVLMSFIAGGASVQLDIPNLMLVFPKRQRLELVQGMSLSALHLNDVISPVLIVQHNDGKLRDYDYTLYGHIATEFRQQARVRDGEKSTMRKIMWPTIAPALTNAELI